jgi:hypothetical protein
MEGPQPVPGALPCASAQVAQRACARASAGSAGSLSPSPAGAVKGGVGAWPRPQEQALGSQGSGEARPAVAAPHAPEAWRGEKVEPEPVAAREGLCAYLSPRRLLVLPGSGLGLRFRQKLQACPALRYSPAVRTIPESDSAAPSAPGATPPMSSARDSRQRRSVDATSRTAGEIDQPVTAACVSDTFHLPSSRPWVIANGRLHPC